MVKNIHIEDVGARKKKEVTRTMLTSEEKLEKVVPADENGEKTDVTIRSLEAKMLSALRKYLSSSIFHDIGPVTAGRIVSVFGVRTAQVIETSLHELLTVKGVGGKRMLAIQNGWSFQRRLMAESAELVKLKLVQ